MSAAPPVISVRGARRVYGDKAAVADAGLDLHAGRITCLLGPSGCGKSTLLRLIAGLEPLDAGEIAAAGRLLSGRGVLVPPEQRDIGLVFQDYALFPHLTIEDNVGFGLRGAPARERRARSLALLERVHLAARARDYPQALSGGEQQRVALARALAREPRAVLLDEPFSGLDSRLKAEVREATLAALRAAGAAVLIVTHDAEEALMMADDLVLMQAGRVLQAGSPVECYRRPASMAAARLLGEVNAVAARIAGGRAETALGDLPAPGLPDGSGEVMVRPEGFVFGDGAPATVVEARFGGAAWRLTLAVGAQTVQARFTGEAPGPGDTVKVRLDPAACAVFAT